MAELFRTILADPDWLYDQFGCAKHGAARAHYPGSAVEVIGRIPVGSWARRDAVVLLWATWPKLDEAFAVLGAWGFRYVTGAPWVKTIPSTESIAQGPGFWFYGASEALLVARRSPAARAPFQRGKDKLRGLLWGDREGPAFYAPRGPHSRKPPSLIEWIEARLPGPRLELYARGERPGWTCWGHATGWHLHEGGVMPLAEAKRLGLVAA